jgi:hypothetical protein
LFESVLYEMLTGETAVVQRGRQTFKPSEKFAPFSEVEPHNPE